MAETEIASGEATPTTTEPSTTHVHHHHHPHIHAPKKLRQFFRPDGRRVHVAHSPEEVEHHRRRMSSVVEKPSDSDDYDIVLHGSLEHVEALREAHSHHEKAREELRRKHGDAYNEFELVHQTLNTLNNELHMISDHAVQLDANFSKYGYSAHLRTKESPNASSANSLMEDTDAEDDHRSDVERYKAQRGQGVTMSFFRQPVVRQYFHKGLLWRASDTTEVASYELFVDLFYVGILAITGDQAAEHATGESLLRFVITFMLSWKFWNDISTAIGWFDSDDVVRRFCVLFMLVCLLGQTTNIGASWETTWTPLISFYIAGRWFSALYFVWMGYLIPMVRAAMIGNALHSFLPGFLWIGTVYVEEPNRQALVWLAIFFDFFGAALIVTFFYYPKWVPQWYKSWADRHFQFYPGANIEHKIERNGAFITLVFGYSVVALLFQNSAAFGINAFFGKAVLGLIQAFSFNWLYFELDSFNLYTHAIRRHRISAMLWMTLHLPLSMAFVLAGAATSKLVLAHDCSDADPHKLWEVYEERSEEHLSDGLRWFYCAGLSISLMCMGVISLCHVYKDIPNQRISKYKRLVTRFIVALVILFLPFAHGLNSLDLIAITTCLVVLALALEIYGTSCVLDPILANSKRQCRYSAKCGVTKKFLAAKSKDGKVVNVEELAKEGRAEHGVALNV